MGDSPAPTLATDMTPDTDPTPAPEGDAAAAPVKTLAADGYDTPSAIQAAIIPHIIEGRDVIGQAQTGTGKTAAFALPILARIFNARAEGGSKHAGGPSVLVLAPTRELAIQVSDAFGKYARNLGGLRTLAVYGGADMRGQQIALHRGVDVVVGTPGRVMDHMRRGSLDVSNLQTLVLDEADEMLRMGFVEDVEWVLGETPPGRQVALFSATMPREIQSIAEKQLNNPERIKTMGGSKTAETVTQRYWRVQGTHKMDALCRLLAYEDVDAAIVFVRTRAATAEVARGLQEAGYPAAALSGDVAQAQRERTVNELRSGRLKLIVATDVAARGIDIDTVTHVFNYDIPHDTEAYIHRIGRTGRAGREGNAILFVNNRERHLLKNIERATGGTTIEKMELPTADDLHALQLERRRVSRRPRDGRRGHRQPRCPDARQPPPRPQRITRPARPSRTPATPRPRQRQPRRPQRQLPRRHRPARRPAGRPPGRGDLQRDRLGRQRHRLDPHPRELRHRRAARGHAARRRPAAAAHRRARPPAASQTRRRARRLPTPRAQRPAAAQAPPPPRPRAPRTQAHAAPRRATCLGAAG